MIKKTIDLHITSLIRLIVENLGPLMPIASATQSLR